MTRKEEIINAAYNEAEVERQLKMHPQVFEQGFVAGAKWADRTMIEKACDWLTRELRYTARGNNFFNNKTATDEFVESFKKAMKQ
jgi:hypothetical protein